MTKNRPKLNCATFFEKFKNCYFFWFFLRLCLKNSSEGNKNNQKKISRCFREICEFLFKKSRKKPTPDFGEIFWKKEHSDFFSFFRRRCLKLSSEGTKNNQKKISSCFREICEFVFRKSKKNPPPILAKLFEKKNIPIFFREYSKNNCRNIYFKEL